MALDGEFLQRLVGADDPIGVIWEEMVGLWRTEEIPADLVAFYNRQEEALSRLEELLAQGYFEVYDLLLRQAREQNGEYVRSHLEGEAVVIVADSLSVREVGLLSLWLGERGWTVQVAGYAVAPFPTVTETLSRQLLGTQPASGRDGAAFAYRYVPGPEQMPALPAGRPTLVWLRLPDTGLEQITVAQATTVAGAFQRTAETLERLLEMAGDRPVTVTSDHGYLYALSPAHYWLLPERTEQEVRRLFPRESRVRPLSDETRRLRPYGTAAPEGRFFVFSGDWVGLRGRYWWATESRNDRCTAHGGLSLAECLVPILRIRRGG